MWFSGTLCDQLLPSSGNQSELTEWGKRRALTNSWRISWPIDRLHRNAYVPEPVSVVGQMLLAHQTRARLPSHTCLPGPVGQNHSNKFQRPVPNYVQFLWGKQTLRTRQGRNTKQARAYWIEGRGNTDADLTVNKSLDIWFSKCI